MHNEPTNEEKRVVSYKDGLQPTIPSLVTFETPLDELNLNWREQDLPEKERTKHVHRLHPYLGKYIPQLVEIFLRKYFSPGQTVLDPFCGSGTTLVQANELGFHSIGYDISAFNTVVCRAKTQHYRLPQVENEVKDILKKVREAKPNEFEGLPLFKGLTELTWEYETDNLYLQNWFAPQARFELLTYRDLIEIGQYEYKDLLRIILCRAARSARLTTHFDLDFPKQPQLEPYWCYKHSRICSPTTEAFKFIERYSLDALRRVEEFSAIRTNANVHVYHDDSRESTFAPIDGVITSPPYVGLIDYHEQHTYAYHLLGLEDKRDVEIGPAAKGKSRKAQSKYIEDMVTVFKNTLQSMSIGGRLIVVAADKDNLYGTIAERLGVEIEYTLERHVNRRTGRRAGEFYESIFIWRKASA